MNKGLEVENNQNSLQKDAQFFLEGRHIQCQREIRKVGNLERGWLVIEGITHTQKLMIDEEMYICVYYPVRKGVKVGSLTKIEEVI